MREAHSACEGRGSCDGGLWYRGGVRHDSHLVNEMGDRIFGQVTICGGIVLDPKYGTQLRELRRAAPGTYLSLIQL